jgi:hypothetical protein
MTSLVMGLLGVILILAAVIKHPIERMKQRRARSAGRETVVNQPLAGDQSLAPASHPVAGLESGPLRYIVRKAPGVDGYGALQFIASVLTVSGWICFLVAALFFLGILSPSTSPNGVGLAFFALVPSLSFALSGILLLAFAQGIHLAIDCATHLATIAENSRRADVPLSNA